MDAGGLSSRHLPVEFFMVEADISAFVLLVRPQTWLITEYEKEKSCAR